MPVITYRKAINDALSHEMARDEKVLVMGEDVAGGAGGTAGVTEAAGGVMGVTAGLATKFGRERVIDTPITESAIMGMGAGAALTGLRPVAELMFADFIGVCFDQIYNQAAKFRYMFGGKAKTPLVIKTLIGGGMGAGPQHSQTIYPFLTMVPGLKVVMPSTPYDAKGMMIQAIRDDDPVVFCEHKMLLNDEGEVPEGDYTVPFKANVVREGDAVTIVSMSLGVKYSLQAAAELEAEGINAEVIDMRSTSPLDIDAVIASVEKTNRLVVVDESNPLCSVASEISSQIAEHAFEALDAPIRKVTAPHSPVPAAPNLEALYMPTGDKIAKVVREVLAFG